MECTRTNRRSATAFDGMRLPTARSFLPECRVSFDHTQLRVRPLAERRSLLQVDDILLDPQSKPAPSDAVAVAEAAERIRAARKSGAAVILMYGAHLLRNG